MNAPLRHQRALPRISKASIVSALAKNFHMESWRLKDPGDREGRIPRSLAMYLCRQIGWGTNTIADYFDCDPIDVVHACLAVENSGCDLDALYSGVIKPLRH